MSLIRQDYILSPYQQDQWVLQIFEQYYIINNDSKKVLDILSSTENYNDAKMQFNSCFEDDFTENQFLGFVKNIFKEIPIFTQDDTDSNPQKSFIKFQRLLINARLAEKLVYPILILFNKSVFWVFFILLSVTAIILLSIIPIPSVDKIPVLWILLLYTPTIFLHELGHIAACNKYVQKNGEIGFGIYFIFPVFYSNISAIWHAKKEERVIANLAGVYMQLWSMLLFLVLFFFTNVSLFLYMSYVLGVYSFIQLIPFIRSDGYWLLSDLSSIPNLQSRSNAEVKRWIKNPLKKIKESSSKDIFIVIYGLFNTLIYGYFIFTQIFFNWEEILNFPLYIIELLKDIVTLNFSEIYFAPQFITSTMFYFICFRYFKQLIERK